MNILTKAQKLGFDALVSNARKKVFIDINKLSLSKLPMKKLRSFYGATTTRAAIERAISNTAARLALKDCDILENAVFDKLAVVKQLQAADPHERLPPNEETVRVNVMNWEIIIIASQAPILFDSSDALVDFCLECESKQMKILFGGA